MRFFPSAARQHVTALTVGVLSVAALALPLAHADEDDLKNRRDTVQGRISDTASDLAEASREAARVGRALDKAQGQLTSARTRLSNVQGRLVEARAVEQRLADELVQAREAFDVAKVELSEGKQAVVDQRLSVRDSILRLYAYGDPQLRALGAFFDNASLEDLQRQDVADKVIVGRGSQELDAFEVAEAELLAQKKKVKAARDTIADKQDAAEKQVATIAGLVEDARVEAEKVAGLVGSTKSARQQALKVKAADKKRLVELRAREKAIKERLVRLARQAAERQARNGGGFSGASDGFLSYPTDGPVTSPYGYRTHPIYGYYGLHNGTDFGVSCGQKLVASAAGKVIDVYSDAVYGKRVFVSVGIVNGKSLVLVYNHLSGYAVSEGQKVSRGQTIGYAGSTGWSTGCHLHFSVMANGNAVNPMSYL